MKSTQLSTQHSALSARQAQAGPFPMSAEDVMDYQALERFGFTFDSRTVATMANALGFAMDDQQGGVTTASVATPVQFLQAWLPGFVRVITAARRIDEFVGIATIGSWEDEQVVQGIVESIGNAVTYGDDTNVPLGTWNVNFEVRHVEQFEKGFAVGRLEEARAGRMRVNSSNEKRIAAALALEIQRNLVGFNGYNNGANRTFGFLNDPNLPAYQTVANGAAASPLWSTKTFLEITADLRTAFATLQVQSQSNINMKSPMTLALATASLAYLSVTPVYGNGSVATWIKDTFPNMRVVDAPQLTAANGGANVFYMFADSIEDSGTDDTRTFVQMVPSRFYTLGVQMRAKDYVEDFSNATAGVMCKRPYAVTRWTGV